MKQIDASGYLINVHDAILKNDNWMFNCPFCDDEKQKCGASTDKQVVHCFKCDYKSTLLQFICAFESCTFSQAVEIIKRNNKSNAYIKHNNKRRFSCDTAMFSVKGYISLPQHKKRRSIAGERAMKYLHTRGLTDNDVRFWNIGISSEDVYIGYIIIPFYENGKLVYFTGRRYIGTGSKYYNPPKKKFNVGKSELVYNIDNASKFERIIICEGVFDVFAAGKNAVAILGKFISDIQFSKIISTGCKEVIVMLDADAKQEAYDIAHKFDSVVQTKVVLLKKADPSKLGSALWTESTTRSYSLKDHLRRKISRKHKK